MIRWDLVRFHWGAGARVALRANGIVGASVVFVFGLDMDALAHLRTTVLELVAVNGGWTARSLFAGISVILAGAAVPRVTLGATGWMRSLPLSSATSRRAAIAALSATQAFTIAVALLSVLGAALVYRLSLDPAKLVGLALLVVAAAALVLPVEHRVGRAVALIALVLSIPGRWSTDLAAAASLVASDLLSGRIVPSRGGRARQWRLGPTKPSPIVLSMRLTARSISKAAFGTSLLVPAVFIAFGYLIVLHNPDLDPATAMRTVRVTGMLALASFTAGLASAIVRTRPAWVWARSLPWSARQRVTGDTLFVGAVTLAVGACLAPLDRRSTLIVLPLAAPLAAGAAAAIRIGARRQTSAGGEVVLLAVIAGAPVALWPWTAVLGVLITPALFARAVRRERRLVVTRWEELHHDAAGDPAWTTAS